MSIAVAGIRESPEAFSAPAIIDLKKPIYGKSAWDREQNQSESDQCWRIQRMRRSIVDIDVRHLAPACRVFLEGKIWDWGGAYSIPLCSHPVKLRTSLRA